MTVFLYRPTAPEMQAGWPYLSAWLQSAIDRDPGRETVEDVRRKVLAKEYQLWTANASLTLYPIAVAITSLQDYPRSRRLLLHLIAGPGREHWTHLLGDLARWARGQGAEAIEAVGRKGWERALPAGWRPVATMYRYDLSEDGRE